MRTAQSPRSWPSRACTAVAARRGLVLAVLPRSPSSTALRTLRQRDVELVLSRSASAASFASLRSYSPPVCFGQGNLRARPPNGARSFPLIRARRGKRRWMMRTGANVPSWRPGDRRAEARGAWRAFAYEVSSGNARSNPSSRPRRRAAGRVDLPQLTCRRSARGRVSGARR